MDKPTDINIGVFLRSAVFIMAATAVYFGTPSLQTPIGINFWEHVGILYPLVDSSRSWVYRDYGGEGVTEMIPTYLKEFGNYLRGLKSTIKVYLKREDGLD